MSLFILDQNASGTDGAAMSRSSFASFHLTGIKPSSGKLMTSSVDRLFENESDVFISSNYNEFNQVRPPERNMCVENVFKKKVLIPLLFCRVFHRFKKLHQPDQSHQNNYRPI